MFGDGGWLRYCRRVWGCTAADDQAEGDRVSFMVLRVRWPRFFYGLANCTALGSRVGYPGVDHVSFGFGMMMIVDWYVCQVSAYFVVFGFEAECIPVASCSTETHQSDICFYVCSSTLSINYKTRGLTQTSL